MSTRALFHDEIAETTGIGVSGFVISERVLARWWCLVAFVKATNLLHQAMRSVSYCRIATAIKMARKVGTCCIVVTFAVALAAAGAIRSD
jgi:hypothetical protein